METVDPYQHLMAGMATETPPFELGMTCDKYKFAGVGLGTVKYQRKSDDTNIPVKIPLHGDISFKSQCSDCHRLLMTTVQSLEMADKDYKRRKMIRYIALVRAIPLWFIQLYLFSFFLIIYSVLRQYNINNQSVFQMQGRHFYLITNKENGKWIKAWGSMKAFHELIDSK